MRQVLFIQPELYPRQRAKVGKGEDWAMRGSIETLLCNISRHLLWHPWHLRSTDRAVLLVIARSATGGQWSEPEGLIGYREVFGDTNRGLPTTACFIRMRFVKIEYEANKTG